MFKRIKLFSWSRDGLFNGLQAEALLQGLIWALACTAFISAALSFWVVLGTGHVYHFSSIVAVGVLVGSLLGGAVGGMAAGKQGWLHGGAVGLLYALALLLFFAAWGNSYFAAAAMAPRLLLMVLAAVLGGVAGVNLKIASGKRGRFYSRLR